MHQSEVYELWIVRVIEAGSNIVYVAMTQVYSTACSHASSVYTLQHNFTFILLSTSILYALNSTTSTVTILCTCPCPIYYAKYVVQ